MINPANMNRMPYDVIINHILPYTYNIQPTSLLLDIRSYYTDFNILKNDCQDDRDNYRYLAFDMLDFYRRDKIFINNSIEPFYETISNKNTIFKQKIGCYFYDRVTPNQTPEKKIKCLFGLLTPVERTRFINKYIIDKMIDNEKE